MTTATTASMTCGPSGERRAHVGSAVGGGGGAALRERTAQPRLMMMMRGRHAGLRVSRAVRTHPRIALVALELRSCLHNADYELPVRMQTRCVVRAYYPAERIV